MATLNWCYGGRRPDIEEAVETALQTAAQYRNKLCELELARRAEFREILRRLVPRYLELDDQIVEMETRVEERREFVKAEKARQRKLKPEGVQGAADEIKRLLADLKPMRVQRRELKEENKKNQELQQALVDMSSRHKANAHQAKLNSGLHWGTEALVRNSCDSFSSKAPPKFRRYRGEGQLGIQLIGGLSCDKAFQPNTTLYIGEEIDRKRRACYIRIGSENRKPIFARVLIAFHRPLPAGEIKWAYLERRKIADHVRWSIRLTIDVDPVPQPYRPGVVSIHLGWRMESAGLRVCTYRDIDGQSGYLRLPRKHCDDYAILDKLDSDRDNAFNGIRDRLKLWLKGRKLPEWLEERRKTIHAWKAKSKLVSMWWEWLKDRQPDDEEIFEELNRWRKEDKRRWQNRCRLSIRITRRRNDIFRCFVKQLKEKYGVVIVSPIDVKQLVQNSEPEDLARDSVTAHRHASWAAPSTLTRILHESYFLKCVEVDSAYMSQRCSKCGEIRSVGGRRQQCKACGHTEDTDERAAKNTLARGMEQLKAGALEQLKVEHRKKRDKQAEKMKRMQGGARARNAKRREAKDSKD